MKKLYWAISIDVLCIILAICLGVFGMLWLPILGALVCIFLILGCRSNRTPKKLWTTILLVLSIVFLIFTVSFGITSKIASNNREKARLEEQVKQKQASITIESVSNTIVNLDEEIEINVSSVDVKVQYLTTCDLQVIGAKAQIVSNTETTSGSKLIVKLTEAEQEEIGFGVYKDGISSNQLTFVIKDFDKDEEPETVEEPQSETSAQAYVAPRVITQTKEVVKEVKVPVEKEVVKEVVKEVPVETKQETVQPTQEPIQEPVVESKPQVSNNSYNYSGYYGDPTTGGSYYNNSSSYSGYYGDPTDSNGYSSNSYGKVSISGSKNVTAGRTYTYTISGVSSFTLSKLEYPSFVTAKKTGSNTFTLTFDDDYTGNCSIDYNNQHLNFNIKISE